VDMHAAEQIAFPDHLQLLHEVVVTLHWTLNRLPPVGSGMRATCKERQAVCVSGLSS